VAELWFYHLEKTELEQALAPLLEKCLQRGWRALVRGGLSERLDTLDGALWTYRDDSFLPHAREAAKTDGARQPVLLTDKPGNPNNACALFAIDGASTEDAADFERACFLFDGRDEASLTEARRRWKAAKSSGLEVSYWKEKQDGGWEKQT
jgi:DNA polymerase-3 subunit chi